MPLQHQKRDIGTQITPKIVKSWTTPPRLESLPSAALFADLRKQLSDTDDGNSQQGVNATAVRIVVDRLEQLELEKAALLNTLGRNSYNYHVDLGLRRMEESETASFLSIVAVVIVVSVVLWLVRRFFKGAHFTENVKAKGKVAIVTGANSGIGKQIAKELNRRGAKVYLFCRNPEKANAAIRELVKHYGTDATRMIVIPCDLSSFASVRKAVSEFQVREERLDFLINNAGIMFYPKFELTADGQELTWQSNYLSHFLLTHLLLPQLSLSEAGRIVNVSSLVHTIGDDVHDETVNNPAKFSRLWKTYARSKVAQVMHAVTLTKRIRAADPTTKVTINACHPGTVDTNLTHGTIMGIPIIQKITKPFIWFFMKTDDDGAQTPLFLALSKKIDGVSGKYFAEMKQAKTNPLVDDVDACNDLYNSSIVACGLNDRFD
uniref:Dehydrogenase/reductase SDR family member 12 n=1 Tax=Panagrellus redivivus TaxID=6233 RepID=A0A7E4US50_PANRE